MVVFGTGCRGCRVKWPLNEHSLWISVCYELLEGAITRLCAPGTSVLHQVCWSQRRPGTRSPRHQGSKWVGTHGSAVFRSDISTIWRFQASKERSLPWEQAGKNLNRNVFSYIVIVSDLLAGICSLRFTHSVLTAIFPGEPGLAGCSLNSPSPFIPRLHPFGTGLNFPCHS